MKCPICKKERENKYFNQTLNLCYTCLSKIRYRTDPVFRAKMKEANKNWRNKNKEWAENNKEHIRNYQRMYQKRDDVKSRRSFYDSLRQKRPCVECPKCNKLMQISSLTQHTKRRGFVCIYCSYSENIKKNNINKLGRFKRTYHTHNEILKRNGLI